MKKTILVLISIAIACVLNSCNSKEDASESSAKAVTTDMINNPNSGSEEIDPADLPVIVFDNEVFEFGQITQGEKVQHAFTFKNTGKSSLIISSASGSCGCTVPSWPKEPIAPGEEGVIDVVFDSNGKEGQQTKTVTLVANTSPSKTVLALKGEILIPEKL